ncbi:reverse transcriptase-like protein [Trifolium medium]|uniref:Reverse transcriptase-like protein n=1 Tax=Trifolium medium TaxID=97028 RepID=A0A392M924_9FABA|nr:reverse transcriptase-like protein [Trifolium medium]
MRRRKNFILLNDKYSFVLNTLKTARGGSPDRWTLVRNIKRILDFDWEVTLMTYLYNIIVTGAESAQSWIIGRAKEVAGQCKISFILGAHFSRDEHLNESHSLLFTRANQHEVESIMEILSTYRKASGHMVNMDKSEVSFSRNMLNEEKEMICNRMGDRVWKKLKGWKEKCLSQAGKEILIKSIVQAISNYIMSCYKLPDGCCKEVEYMAARFWWGSNDDARKLHWMSWDRLAKAKNRGGMGFRSFKDFNKTLLGKHSWRLMTDETSLVARIFKARYYPRSSFMEANVGYQPSYAWRSIVSAKDILEVGARWSVCYGAKIRIWQDRWIPNQSDFKVWSPVNTLSEDSLVETLIDSDTKQWKRDLIHSCFNRTEAKQILSIPLSHRLPMDKLVWHWEKDGGYSVRSAHHLLQDIKKRDTPGSSISHSSTICSASQPV